MEQISAKSKTSGKENAIQSSKQDSSVGADDPGFFRRITPTSSMKGL